MTLSSEEEALQSSWHYNISDALTHFHAQILSFSFLIFYFLSNYFFPPSPETGI